MDPQPILQDDSVILRPLQRVRPEGNSHYALATIKIEAEVVNLARLHRDIEMVGPLGFDPRTKGL